MPSPPYTDGWPVGEVGYGQQPGGGGGGFGYSGTAFVGRAGQVKITYYES